MHNLVCAYNPKTREVEAGESETQGHPQLHEELESLVGEKLDT